MAGSVRVQLSDSPPIETEADLLCVGLFEDEELPEELAGAPGSADVRAKFKSLAVLRPEAPSRVLVVGLGARTDLTPERARVAAALGVAQSRRFEATSIAWACPEEGSVAAALAAGTILASYRFDRFKTSRDEDDQPDANLELLTLHGAGDAEEIIEVARVASEAANRARDLQNLPPNIADPTYLANRAAEIVSLHEGVEFEVLGREQLEAEGMGGMLAVSAGSARDPALIVLRYSGGGKGPTLGLVGKAVTFDSGGISIKPGRGMSEMKADMSGGAAVLEATAAIARLKLPVSVIAVIGATENMPSGRSVKPGDIVRARSGTTIEIINTDAEGRLVLCDCLTHAREQGADRLIDVATLTGGIVVALGSVYAGLFATDDKWSETVSAAGERAGELYWRLPLHDDYAESIKSRWADITNANEDRKASSIVGAEFLRRFTGDTPWAHLDIAGVGWDRGSAYADKGGSGFATRTLIEVARGMAS